MRRSGRRLGISASVQSARVGWAGLMGKLVDRGCFPSFVGLGAQRCGTTWWFSQIMLLPDVSPPVSGLKELHVLDRPADSNDESRLLDLYQAQFDSGSRINGEWTPSYLSNPYAIDRLTLLPAETRFLVLLRDPRHRISSAIDYQRTRHGQLSQGELQSLVWRSLYGSCLRSVLSAIDQERILVQTLETCVRQPTAELTRVANHLGIEWPVDGVPISTQPTNEGPPTTGSHDWIAEQWSELLEEDARLLARLGYEDIVEAWHAA
ncbi:MAG: sulfotransferase [Actinomycetia bacterium]|nr:sulfotransferase [Actinomycetes bacterium]